LSHFSLRASAGATVRLWVDLAVKLYRVFASGDDDRAGAG